MTTDTNNPFAIISEESRILIKIGSPLSHLGSWSKNVQSPDFGLQVGRVIAEFFGADTDEESPAEEVSIECLKAKLILIISRLRSLIPELVRMPKQDNEFYSMLLRSIKDIVAEALRKLDAATA